MMTDNASAIGIGALLALLLTVCILPLAGFEVTTESLLFLGTGLRQVSRRKSGVDCHRKGTSLDEPATQWT